MDDVIIIGAGGHAAEITEYISYSQKITNNKEIKIIGYIADDPKTYKMYNFSSPLLGGIHEHKVRKNQSYIIGIASLKYRRSIVEKINAAGGIFISFKHIGAYVSESAIIDEGTIVGPNVNIGPNVIIGKYNLLNSRCSIGHDSVVGDYNIISPNVCFSGFTKIGNENLFGINSATIPGITVGNRNEITAGMIIDRNIKNDSIFFHRFREKILAIPNQ